MANILFRPADLLSEIGALNKLAAKFLDPASPFQLEELASDIKGLQTHGAGKMNLEIPKARPLQTRVSEGEFEPPNKTSNRRVQAKITGIWEIEVASYKVQNLDRPKKKAKSTLLIGFTGKASTVVSVSDEDSEEPIACWKMELGDANAPGCFFHTFASLDHNFPVPRHPNVFPTPMSAIGFTLGELFQSGWEQVVSGASDPPTRWRSIQRKRLEALLKWQLKQVEEATVCPWFAMKVAKPDAQIFL